MSARNTTRVRLAGGDVAIALSPYVHRGEQALCRALRHPPGARRAPSRLPAGLPPEPPTPPVRRGGIGPFSRRQLLLVLGVVVVAAVVLFLVTRPIAQTGGVGGLYRGA